MRCWERGQEMLINFEPGAAFPMKEKNKFLSTVRDYKIVNVPRVNESALSRQHTETKTSIIICA